MAEAMQAERTAQEQRRLQLNGLEDNDDKLEELHKDEQKWKDKYRRRVKALTTNIRDPKNTPEYLEIIEVQYDDLSQADEFLQETYSRIIKVMTTLNKNVDEIKRIKNASVQNFDRQTQIFYGIQQEILSSMRQVRQETYEAEIRRQKLEYETELTRERRAQAQAQAQLNPPGPEIQRRNANGQNNPMGKLKKVDLPKFDGKLSNYFRWKSTFDV
jgi:chromosome segregation ATPase